MIGSISCILGVAAAIWIVTFCLGLCYEAATTAGEDEQCDLLTGGDGEAKAVHRCWAQLMFYWAEGSSLVLDGVVLAVGGDHVMTPVGTPFSLRFTQPGHDLPRTVLRLMCLAGGGDTVLLHIRDADDGQRLRLRADGLDITVPLECADGWPVLNPHGGHLWT